MPDRQLVDAAFRIIALRAGGRWEKLRKLMERATPGEQQEFLGVLRAMDDEIDGERRRATLAPWRNR